MRMNREILISYCEKLGYDIENDDFWKNDDVLYFERFTW